MADRTERQVFASVAHQLAGQAAILMTVRDRITPDLTAAECRLIVEGELAEVRARLALNAAVGKALVAP